MLVTTISPALTLASEYKVKKGDTLWSLSRMHKTTVEDIKEINKLKNDNLSIGQTLKFDKSNDKEEKPSKVKSYTVKKGDTLWSISQKNKVSVNQIKKINDLKSDVLRIGQKLKFEETLSDSSDDTKNNNDNGSSNTNKKDVYIVEAGDTLWKISREVGVVVDELIKINNLKSDLLKVGQKIKFEEKNSSKEMATTENLNLRESNTTNSKVILTIPKGTLVKAGKLKGDWYEVEYLNKKGFAHKDYLIDDVLEDGEANGNNDDVKKDNKYYKVSATSLHLRKSDSVSSASLGLMPKGEKVEFIEKANGIWWKVKYGNKTGYASSEYLVEIKGDSTENDKGNNKLIVVDPGHGGFDPGVVNGSITENMINGNVSNYLKNELISRGYQVLMTREGLNDTCSNTTSTSIELKCRVDLANDNNADLYISVHANSATPLAKGTETYYSDNSVVSAKSASFARTVHKYYQPVFNSSDRGVKTANLYVNRYTQMPSILLELGFVTNPSDLSKLTNSSVQREVAKGIADGVDEYSQ